jgi:hypothetical protein
MALYPISQEHHREVSRAQERGIVDRLSRIGGEVQWSTLTIDEALTMVDAVLAANRLTWRISAVESASGGTIVIRRRGRTVRYEAADLPRLGRPPWGSKYRWEDLGIGESRTFRAGATTASRLHSSFRAWSRARCLVGRIATATQPDGGIAVTRLWVSNGVVPLSEAEEAANAAALAAVVAAVGRPERRPAAKAAAKPPRRDAVRVPETPRGPPPDFAAVHRELVGAKTDSIMSPAVWAPQPKAPALPTQALPTPPDVSPAKARHAERKAHTDDLVVRARAHAEAAQAKPEAEAAVDPMAELEAMLAAERSRAAAEDPELTAMLGA